MTPDEIIAILELAWSETGLEPALLDPIRAAARGQPPPAADDGDLEEPIGALREYVHAAASSLMANEAKRVTGVRTLLGLVFHSDVRDGKTGRAYAEIARAVVASADRSPATLLDILVPPPRALSGALASSVLGDVSAAELRELLAAAEPSARILAARIVAARHREELADDIGRVATHDAHAVVRAEALEAIKKLPKPVWSRIASTARTALLDEDPRARAAAIVVVTTCRESLAADVVARLLDDADEDVREAALHAALAIATTVDDAGAATLVDALTHALQRSQDPRLAIWVLGQIGPRAKAASVEIARSLSRSSNPYQGAQMLVAVGALEDAMKPILEEHARGWSSPVAQAAEMALKKLGAIVVEVPLDHRLERIRRELASDDPNVRWSGMFAAGLLGDVAAPLLPTIRAIGERAALDASVEGQRELKMARDTLVKLGCKPEDLPVPPGRLQPWRGNAPREGRKAFGLVVGSISSRVEHGAVSVPVSSLGLWDDATGKTLFVVPRAELLVPIRDGREAAVVRTEVRADAKYGGTSRSDVAWFFERYAVPSGELLTSLALPATFTYGWPAALDVAPRGEALIATVTGGEEDRPYTFEVVIAEERDADRLLSDAPVPMARRR